MKDRLKKLLTDETGVTSVEYGLVALLVALAIVAGVTLVGTNVRAMYEYVESNFPALPG
jgi:pilus assembly protein Flp/PilA